MPAELVDAKEQVADLAPTARFTPHTAFADPTTPRGTPPRQSIEFRTIAFFD